MEAVAAVAAAEAEHVTAVGRAYVTISLKGVAVIPILPFPVLVNKVDAVQQLTRPVQYVLSEYIPMRCNELSPASLRVP